MHAYIEYDIGTTASLQRAFMCSGWTLLQRQMSSGETISSDRREAA